MKGDEFFILAEVSMVMSCLFFVGLQIVVKKLNWVLVLILPILNIFLSFFLGLGFAIISSFDSYPNYDIWILGVVYMIVTLIEGMVLWRKPL